MKDVKFEYQGIFFCVRYANKQRNIYKLVNDKCVELNDKELEMVNTLLNSQYSYVYNSERLREIVEQNQNLENKEYLYNFLIYLENIIPPDCRDNFYRNVTTLFTKLNLDFNGDIPISNSYITAGGYDTENNLLTISPTMLSGLREVASKMNAPEEFYWQQYSQILLHELAHMSSSNFNSETKVALSGFDTFPSQELEDSNRGLTEGFTEIIAMSGVPGTLEIASGYYIEASIINQLILIIGNEELIRSYFLNLGIENVKLKLQELIPSSAKTFLLFRNIELNYQIGHSNNKQNVLGTIQSTLLDYLEVKIKKMFALGQNEEILNILNIYEQFLITPTKLEKMQKDPNNYIDLTSSLERFEELKKLYLGMIHSSDEEEKSKQI